MVQYLRSTADSQRRIDTSSRPRRLKKDQWVDLFPEIHGTQPEKMVYAELTRLGIPFLFLNDMRFQIPEIDFDKWYQADFIIPSIRVIIEVQGAYWHSKPDALESDAFKLAVYESTGWKALAWWDYDILDHVQELVMAEPLLLSIAHPGIHNHSTELPVQRRTKIDTSKGIRTLNSRRFKAKNVIVKKNTIRKSIGGIF